MAQNHENPSRPQELTSSEDAQETEIQPLSDEALEEAAGGVPQDLCSYVLCSNVD